jgi:hypothetical protein
MENACRLGLKRVLEKIFGVGEGKQYFYNEASEKNAKGHSILCVKAARVRETLASRVCSISKGKHRLVLHPLPQ